jgi:hypothetical protein
VCSWCSENNGEYFYGTINSEGYLRLILILFFDQLIEDESPYGHFMQDNDMAHKANNSMKC